ncbi:MAG: alanine--tRNA ligase, partial [Anaerolineae bacterium]|nr:alanine--tRNA ligase [Anaerolineae bacterium]
AHVPHGALEISAQVVGLLGPESILERAAPGEKVELVLDCTNFYVESGGQVSDTGRITGPGWEFQVEELHEPIAGLLVHLGHVVHGSPGRGDPVQAMVARGRRQDIMRNHTATHLLHRALRAVLGTHVAQAGSRVGPERLRFDYNQNAPLTPEQRAEIERIVTGAVLANYTVTTRQENYRDALAEGVIALFGEKYGDVVRVVRVGESAAPFSQELCGGAHVQRTGDIGPFMITSESGIGAGIRRIEAVTGRGALQAMQAQRRRQEKAAALLGGPAAELPAQVARLQAELQESRREIAQLHRQLARDNFQSLLAQTVEVHGIPVLAAVVEAPDMETLREMADWFRAKSGESVIVLGAVIEGNPRLIAATTLGMIARGVHAGQLIGKLARLVGGGGGGRPDMAQAGGRDASKLPGALAQVPQLLAEIVG